MNVNCEKIIRWSTSKRVDQNAASERHVCKRMENELLEHQTKRKMSRPFSHLRSATQLQHPTSVFVFQHPSAAGSSHAGKIMATNIKSKIRIRFEITYTIVVLTHLKLFNELHKFSCTVNLNCNGC